jgi:ATP-binding cassette subfamily B protein
MAETTENQKNNHPFKGMRFIDKPKNLKLSAKRLLKYYLKNKFLISVVAVFIVLSTALIVIAPEILGKVTTELYNGVIAGAFNWNKIVIILISLTLIYVFAQLFRFLYSFIMAKINATTIFNIRREVDIKINKLPLKYFDKYTHGEVISRVTNDIETINATMQQGIVQIINSLATVVGIVTMMFIINIYMAIIALVVIPLSVITSSKVIKKSQKYFIGQQANIGEINGHIEEMYSGHSIVKVFNYEDKAKEKFVNINNNLYNNAMHAEFYSGTIMPIVSFFGNIGYAAIAILGCLFAINGTIEVGQIQSFIVYMRQFMQPLNTITNMVSYLQSTIAAAERVFEVLDEQEEVSDSKLNIDISEIKGNVEIKNVRFGYDKDVPIIKNLNFKVNNGATVAIVGPTGAGKTTLINLLMRFYDVDNGEILIDGINIKDIKRDDLHSIFGMVLQDTWLFNGSIEENLAYGKNGTTHNEIVKAAKTAYCDHFIKTLPDSYNMIINEEANNLSLGQKQLLTIARAILANPKILILDEATSSVDTRTEVQIQKAMHKLMKGRTSFVIAHRLSTIVDADIILVMNNGDVIEQGTHEELLKLNGFYTNLYNSQFEKAENY